MRILHVTSHLNIGGVTSYVLSLSKTLAQRGHRIIVASGGGQLEDRVNALGGTHWRAPLSTSVEFSPQVFAASRTLARQLQHEPVDVLHAHTRVGQVVADRLSRRCHVPYVTTWHGFFRPNLGRSLWPCLGDATIAISEPVRRHLVQDFHVPSERVHLIPHGIDPAPFEAPADPAAQQRLREQVGIPCSGPVVGAIARLVPSKGVDHLVRSFVQVRASLLKTHLLIVGDGTQRSALESLVRTSGLEGAVHFAGKLPETRVGHSLLEAMASARPIVAVRRGGGAAWVLEDSGIGALVEPDDPASLGQAVVQLLRDGEAACRQAGRARAVVKERYSLTRVVDQVEALYRDVIAARSS